jgi:hypothetical protein
LTMEKRMVQWSIEDQRGPYLKVKKGYSKNKRWIPDGHETIFWCLDSQLKEALRNKPPY